MSRLIDADALLETMENFFTKVEDEARYTGRRNAEVTWNDAVYMIKTAPTIEPEPQWIPCSERLPESDERVLVYTVANEYHVWDAMTHRGEDYAWEDEEGFCHNLYEVGMWMPLPEPCQQEAERWGK